MVVSQMLDVCADRSIEALLVLDTINIISYGIESNANSCLRWSDDAPMRLMMPTRRLHCPTFVYAQIAKRRSCYDVIGQHVLFSVFVLCLYIYATVRQKLKTTRVGLSGI